VNRRPPLLDTNVIVRYFVEDPSRTDEKFRGVFSFFPRVEAGEISVEIPDLVLFETFFVLTKIYRVPPKEAANKLSLFLGFRGIVLRNKPLIQACLRLLQIHPSGLVDAYLLALARQTGVKSIYSYDKDLVKKGFVALEIK
jgi:predicted nucleic acid-binding protein